MSSVKQRKKDKNPSKKDSTASRESSPVKEDVKAPLLLASPQKAIVSETVQPNILPEKAIPAGIRATRNNDFAYKIALYIVSLLAILTRSWMIHHPGEVVFDEVHFGKFASYYLRGEYYFDVHPPLGKLLIALIGKLVGYNGHFLFDSIGDNYAENNVPYIALRLWCATCGAAVVPIAFLIMKELGVSVAGCLLGSLMLVFGKDVLYFSNITIAHSGTNHFLHSHEHVYPLRYDSGRVSSNGQQVNAYAHFDNNSYWQILPVETEYFPEKVELSDEEKKRGIRYVRHDCYVRLRHVSTNTYLITHDVASPLTTTNMEVTTLDPEKALSRYNDTVWKIYISDNKDKKKRVKSKKSTIVIQSAKHNVALFTSKEKLPDWGFSMQEINGNKKTAQKSNHWTIQDVKHEKIVAGTINLSVEKEKPKNKPTMSFLKKFFELQGLMIHHNNALTSSHPYSSSPITWPFVIRGISFWEKKEGVKQIYLIGNPIAWWLSIIGPLFYFAMWLVDRILLRRGIDDFGPAVRQWWDKSIGFMCIAWLLHWIPFFLMGRQLFLHHYMPAYIFSTIAFATLFDFLGRSFMKPLSHIPKNTPMVKWHGGQGGIKFMVAVFVVILAIFASFYYFMPFCYGTGYPDVPTLRTRKWFATWDFQYA
ncbi:hypothetical protein HDV01_006126 [Terramyces sp. JEL0728]|nr:hypothetical protein HDV01_006126 [Terramyces sp. JEL0728]